MRSTKTPALRRNAAAASTTIMATTFRTGEDNGRHPSDRIGLHLRSDSRSSLAAVAEGVGEGWGFEVVVASGNSKANSEGSVRKPDQIIHPWMFGHGEVKATCLWLKGLPKLIPTNIVDGREARVHRMPPSPDRWKERSRTMQGIASAMADQWG